LTHAAIYESDKNVGAVIHCHDLNLWWALLRQIPATSAAVDYGTPEMACEVMRLFRTTDVRTRKILVMTGHEGGMIAFGKDLAEAFAILMREWQTAVPGCLP
jgi:L-ribulose-5-phosphate 4-epimerase